MPIVAADPSGNQPRRVFAPDPWNEQHPRQRDLEQELADDHLARWVEQAVARLDLEPLWQSYGGTGSLPHRPDRMLAAVLFQLQRGRHSPALWFQDAQESVPMRWLLRGGRPCRSCWYNFRDRLGPMLDAVNHQVLQQAQQDGITLARCGSLDGTLVAANASRHKLVNETTLDKRLTQARAQAAQDSPTRAETAAVAAATGTTPAAAAPAAPVGPASVPVVGAATAATAVAALGVAATTPRDAAAALPMAVANGVAPQAATPPSRPGWMAPTQAGRKQQLQCLEKASQRMRELQARNGGKRASKRKQRDQVVVSVSDPEAALGRDKDKIYRPLYNVQLMDDLDSPLILGYEVLAQPNDAGLLGLMSARTKQLVGHTVKVALADSAYSSGADLAAAEAAGVTLFAALPQEAANGKYLPKSQFAWSAAQQSYVCPQGHPLEYEGTSRQQRSSTELVVLDRYRCSPSHCLDCPQRSACTPCPDKGRTISRGEHEELIEALRQRMDTDEAKELYRLRSQTVELVNADFKEHRRLRRFSGRGLKRARTEVGLLVLAHNLLVLVKHGQRPPAETAPPSDANPGSPNP